MSWTSVFPVLTEEQVSEYRELATPAEKTELAVWLGVQKRINLKPSPHLVAVSIFWKNLRQEEPDLPPLTRELLKSAAASGLVRRHDPWEHYIQPVLAGAVALGQSHPQATVRIYLAADLEFLVEDFTAAGCEVFLMKSSSLRHNPGAMWRFLAFAERNRLVTVTDSDRFAQVATDIARTEQIAKTGHEFWRVPVCVDQRDGRVQYRPIMATQCGSAKAMPPVRPLMEALIWHTRRGSIRLTAEGGGCGPQGIVGTEWPDYGFDEWFLQTALYPRLAGRPVLTLVEAGARSRYLPLDIEYVTWGNPESEVVYFGSESGCCGPGSGSPPTPEQRAARAGYWRSSESLGLVANHLGLTGSGVEFSSSGPSLSRVMEKDWKGKRWLALVAAGSVAGTNAQSRVKYQAGGQEKAWRGIKAGSQDVIWLPQGAGFSATLRRLREAWRKLKEGGMMGGGDYRDEFIGRPHLDHRWVTVRQALEHWQAEAGAMVFANERNEWLAFKGKLPAAREVVVVSAATADVTYAKATAENHRAYCRRHGYRYHMYGEEVFKRDKAGNLTRAGCWFKIKALLRAMQEFPGRWFYWIDADAIINNPEVELRQYAIGHFDIVCPTWEDVPGPRPSSGTILFQKTATARRILEKTWALGRRRIYRANEEDALREVLTSTPKLGRRLLGLPTRYLNSTPPHGNNWEPADFILHFLAVRGDRREIIEDAIAMINARTDREGSSD